MPDAAAGAFRSAQRPRLSFWIFDLTLFFGVPTIYVRLLDFDAETARADWAAARLFVSGSAPLPAEVLREFREAVRA